MTIKKKTFKFSCTKTVITYDLSNNDVSASTIASQSNHLYTTISIGNETYNLPNTTLCSDIQTAEGAEAEFRSAFAKTGSNAKITRLFTAEVFDQFGYIENNEQSKKIT